MKVAAAKVGLDVSEPCHGRMLFSDEEPVLRPIPQPHDGAGGGASSEEEKAELTRGVMVNLFWPAAVSHCTGGQ